MNTDGLKQLKFVEGGAELLDRIEPLWKQQTALHVEKSLHFAESFTTANFSDRKRVFDQKARSGTLLVILAIAGSDEIAGYTVCSVCEQLSDLGACKIGEIDSMFILASYRRLGIGRKFLVRSMEWFEQNRAEKVIALVAVGNEEVLEFYRHAGLLPRAILLQRKDQKEH
ncbi:MAG: GNAT family N-acetyltransferase [Verrucomicrobia bacterium]|nr:GNAT family N-acetyltransferase [Verrucomicrobiota bacterium]MBV8486349.1 GNAT family N-acetyltransferase [Verrucomicrobiota bacterium]